MNDTTRRALAYIIGCLNTKNHNTFIFDYTEGKHFSFSFNGTSVYDYSKSYFLSLSRTSNYSYNIYSHLNRSFITLRINGNRFSGYDFNTSSNISGNVNGKMIYLYDFEKGKYFNYSI